ncbi:probable Xaa-Pro aminopeptidase P [Coccinella septempunctata]|uniref:probable Xaa-Pro aminopeptidase P n=1 Tax=Coccinella septempunctata TaxID=41139 RepID=UPI001D05D062|nr:probable Xaa-Pro aminopeptidase P [Coccinella septempunctata]
MFVNVLKWNIIIYILYLHISLVLSSPASSDMKQISTPDAQKIEEQKKLDAVRRMEEKRKFEEARKEEEKERSEEFIRIERMRISGELRKACSERGNAVLPATRVNTTMRLIQLRELMNKSTVMGEDSIDGYIITSDDEHQTEFVSEYDRRREYITGFSGSHGTAIVTHTKAALWTDGRYHLEADDQMSCDWLLMRSGQRDISTMSEWLKNEFPKGARIGVDPKLVSEHMWQTFMDDFKNSSIVLVPIKLNLIDIIWSEGRAPRRNKSVFVHHEKYAGKSWKSKVADLRNETRKLGADAMIVTALDEIAWLLNIRGRDVPYSPFVRSYVLVDMVKVILYINKTQLLKHDVIEYFMNTEGVSEHSFEIKGYTDIWTDLPTQTQAYDRVLIPTLCEMSLGASHAIYSLIPPYKQLPKHSPIIYMKAVKNPTEIEGMRNAHIRDAAAMCEFFAYLEERFKEKDVFTELDLVKTLDDFRFAQEMSIGNSFRTIVAFGSNAAYPRYEPRNITNKIIFDNGTLILDSGGQYLDGTTDVTRTIHLGIPTKAQKRAYTKVLIGHIQMSTLTFPENLHASSVDVLARAPLWEVGLDYQHPTSHGVGSFLGVHESPIKVEFKAYGNQTFKPGYFLSLEPGYYSEGEFGVRLENVVEVVERKWLPPVNGYRFLGFKDRTLVPYNSKLLDMELLSSFQRRWLNKYNKKIRTLVGLELKKQMLEKGFRWLMDNTAYIPENRANNILHFIPALYALPVLITFRVDFLFLV